MSNKVPHHHTILKNIYGVMESQVVFLWWHVTKLHVVKKNYFPFFFNKKNFDAITMIYMFVYCMCIKYINAHIHQGFKH
jgi:hypothetical protein